MLIYRSFLLSWNRELPLLVPPHVSSLLMDGKTRLLDGTTRKDLPLHVLLSKVMFVWLLQKLFQTQAPGRNARSFPLEWHFSKQNQVDYVIWHYLTWLQYVGPLLHGGWFWKTQFDVSLYCCRPLQYATYYTTHRLLFHLVSPLRFFVFAALMDVQTKLVFVEHLATQFFSILRFLLQRRFG